MDPLQILKAYPCCMCLSGRYNLIPNWWNCDNSLCVPLTASNPTTPKPGCRNSRIQRRPMYCNVPKTLLRLEQWSIAATTDLWTWNPKLIRPPQPLRPLRLIPGRFLDPLQILKAYPCRTCLSERYHRNPYLKRVTLCQQPLCPHLQPLIQPLQSLVAGTVYYKIGLCTSMCQKLY